MPAVKDLHLAAFGDHGQAEADLVDDLRGVVTSSAGLSVVAEDEIGVVGHVMFTRSLLDAPQRLVYERVLCPVAVSPEHLGQGMGSALIR
jgi:putative acetyltransferase